MVVVVKTKMFGETVRNLEKSWQCRFFDPQVKVIGLFHDLEILNLLLSSCYFFYFAINMHFD